MHTMRKPENDSVVLTPGICQDFSGAISNEVEWQGGTPTYTISQVDSNHVFPFTPAITGSNGLLEINFPTASIITIKPGLNTKSPNNVYTFNVSCCPMDSAPHTVTVSG